MNLYVTRHGQTDGNLYRIMDGIRDIDLNEEGKCTYFKQWRFTR
jgi:broad specificity phosphatase PhoE